MFGTTSMAKVYMKANPDVRDRLMGWFGEKANVLQIWEQDKTFFAVVKNDNKLSFARLFYIGEKLEISIDEQVHL
jgi:hypothetical protein